MNTISTFFTIIQGFAIIFANAEIIAKVATMSTAFAITGCAIKKNIYNVYQCVIISVISKNVLNHLLNELKDTHRSNEKNKVTEKHQFLAENYRLKWTYTYS